MDCWRDVGSPAGAGECDNSRRVRRGACSAGYRQLFGGNNWNALKPIKGVKWRDATLKEAPSAFAQEADVTLDGHGRGTVLVVGARQMMFDVEVSLPRLFEKKGLAQTLKAQFSPATLIEQLGGECRKEAAGVRLACVSRDIAG